MRLSSWSLSVSPFWSHLSWKSVGGSQTNASFLFQLLLQSFIPLSTPSFLAPHLPVPWEVSAKTTLFFLKAKPFPGFFIRGSLSILPFFAGIFSFLYVQSFQVFATRLNQDLASRGAWPSHPWCMVTQQPTTAIPL